MRHCFYDHAIIISVMTIISGELLSLQTTDAL